MNIQDHPNNVIAGVDAEDMHIAYIQNSRIPTCINTQFDRDPNCGTTYRYYIPSS